jgi:site-specific DNA recombinase
MGKPLGGQASFGYRWQNKTLVIDQKEAPVRKLIYEIFLECQRKKTTASRLNQLGYRTRKGANFSDTTVERLLRDTTAKGLRIANHTKSTGEGKKWLAKSQEDWITIPCPAIIEEDLWDKCNKRLKGIKTAENQNTCLPVLLNVNAVRPCMYIVRPKSLPAENVRTTSL